MRLTPTPTPGATSSVACNPKTHACDTPGGEGLSAAGIFAACVVVLLAFAWFTSLGRSSR